MDITSLGQTIFYGVSTGMAYALFAIGLSLIWGIVRVLNCAHGEFYMLGAMFAWVFVTLLGLNFVGGMFIVIALSAVIGLIVNRIAIQPLLGKPNFLLLTFISTIGVSMVLMNSTAGIWGETVRAVKSPFTGAFSLGGVQFTQERLFMLGIGVLTIVLVHLLLTRTTLGKSMQAVAQNPIGARLVGINLKRVYALGFAIAGMLSSLSGFLLVPIWYGSPRMGAFMLLKGFAIVVVAGLGSVMGAVWVGIGIGVIEALFADFVSVYYREAFVYGIMIVVLLVRPTGLFGKAR